MAKLSPVFNDQTFDASGNPAVGYKLFTYAAGSSTKQTAYTDSAGTVPHPNPIIINASGYPTTGPIWLTAGQTYKMVLTTSTDTDPPTSPVKTIDNVTGINDSSSSNTQWVSSGVTPTYVSGTSFTMPGDQTTEFHVGRRLQFTVTAGTVYGTISASVFGALTTVTVTMDSGALDTGLSNVNLSILRADNLAIPGFVTGAYGCRGLIGNVNAGTPLTKFDLSANAVTLRNAAGATMTRYTTGTLTCDLGLAGSAANGRDQAAAFTASSWIYLYFIWNGTTLASLASTTAPASFTGSTLPSGYTHWAFATAIRWNGSSNIVKARALGSKVWYELDVAGANRALSGGTATVFTTLNLAALAPPTALMVVLSCSILCTHNAIQSFELAIRPTGSGLVTGLLAAGVQSQVANVQCETVSEKLSPLGTSTQIDYRLSNAPNVGGGVYIDVAAYTVPNGDA